MKFADGFNSRSLGLYMLYQLRLCPFLYIFKKYIGCHAPHLVWLFRRSLV